MQFRDDTKGNVIDSLGTGNALIYLVRALLCVDLLFTAPMLLAIGREIVEHSVMSSGFGFTVRFPESTRNILRTSIVIFILGLAYIANVYAQNAFYNVVSLVGGICGFTLGFIYPPALYIAVFREKLGTATLALNIFIILLGAVLLVASTFYTVQAF
jgi:hypothetical protein